MILQTDPASILHEVDEAVSAISNSSIEIAQAVADFGALRVIFGIFIVFIAILLVMFVWQVLTTNSKITFIKEVSEKTSEYFAKESDRTIGKEQANVIIRRAFNYLSVMVKFRILRTRIENHLDDREAVNRRISQLLNNEFSETESYLNNFILEGNPLREYLHLDDVSLWQDLMIEWIYLPREQFNISSMDQSVDIFVQGIKLQCLNNL